MGLRKQIGAIVGAATFGIVIIGVAISAAAESFKCAAAGDLRTEEQCACEAALKDNSIEALEGFLEKYGDTSGTACTALARVSLDRFRPDNDPDIGPPTDGSPYAN
jgi:hypothetical protein